MGGQKSGGGARTPYEAPNKLSSAQMLRIVDVISEGVVAGFANLWFRCAGLPTATMRRLKACFLMIRRCRIRTAATTSRA